MDNKKVRKPMKQNKHKRNYKKRQKEIVKLYEIDIVLSRDGKSYKAYAPACTTQGVINGLNHIVDYMRKYKEIKFDVGVEPVV